MELRFLATGNGGWAGGINYPDIVTGLKKGKFRPLELDMVCKVCNYERRYRT
jgi:hypothetical protein